MPTACARRVVACAALALFTAACGQKGPPLAPLHLVPAAVTEVAARRVEDRVRLRFVLPSRNLNGPGPVQLDRVEIYAMTIAPGAPTPPNRELLTRTYLVGQVSVRPAPVEGEAPKDGDTRPEPGALATFDEELTAQKLTPVVRKTEVEAPVPATTAPASTTPAPPAPKDPVRVYALRGIAKSGRPGPPAPRVQLSLVPLPAAPVDVATRVTETSVVIEWKPAADGPTDGSYNIYRADDAMQPVNLSPVAQPPFEYTGAKFDEEQCFRVRSVTKSGDVTIEGPMSSPDACATPRDVFPPAAPKGLQVVATEGRINLIWDANTEKDLAGYIVLRGDAPDGALQPITPTPIRETSYRDAAVKAGARYIYAIVAVDNATPPNTSAQSERKEETAR